MHSVKDTILEYLTYDHYTWGGKMARDICQRTGHKESVIERRARELVNEGKLEVEYQQVEGKGPYCVTYRKRRMVPVGQLF